MPLVKKDKFAPSQRPVALNPDTYKGFQVGKKNGKLTLSYGSFSKWCYPYDTNSYDPSNWEDFLRRANTQQGGMHTWYKWDGKILWSADELDEEDRPDIVLFMRAAYDKLPAVPDEHEGWLYKKQYDYGH